MPTSRTASSDADRIIAVRVQLEHIADHVLKIGLLGGGLVAHLPERSQGTVLRHLEEIDTVVGELRAAIVDLSAAQ